MRIRDDDYDVEPLQESDFEEEPIQSDRHPDIYGRTSKIHALYAISMSKLSTIGNQLLSHLFLLWLRTEQWVTSA